MDAFDIRARFLDFFEERGHRRYSSAPLIPDDPATLLTIAGMLPFKPYFLGDADPPAPRATSFQKCVRTNDIENVGRTRRHMSFFEMLGNFSFGDYFKAEAIAWAWELSVDVLELDPQRIWVTIYEEDDEAGRLWESETDVPAARIQRVGTPEGATRQDASDNFWSLGGAGPCGPCTELYYDLGPEWGEEGGPVVDEERFLEYYNLVFMQYRQDAEGEVEGDLPNQNVDTGMGLERMARIKQGVDSVFDIDTLRPLVDRASAVCGVAYGADEETDVSLRVVAEHARAAAFLIGDGVLPAKEGRGYVLRRVLRRAVRHAQLLESGRETGGGRAGDRGGVMEPMIDQVIATMSPGYPDLERQRELIRRVAAAEESDFRRRISQGLEMLEEVVEQVREAGEEQLSGEVAFKLHDTYGFPVDLTAEIAEDEGLVLDRDEFDRLMQQQRERARAAARGGGDGVPAEVYREAADTAGSTEFVGYEKLASESRLAAIVAPEGLLRAAHEGQQVEVVLPRTPFYAEGGGQVGDRGWLETDSARLRVLDTREAIGGITTHRVEVVAGEARADQEVHAAVDAEHRDATERSHSATHVLHATIREILGEHAQQAGSLVEPGRLRFDFPHFEQVAEGQLEEIEEMINLRVLGDPGVSSQTMPLDEARQAGALANFEEKYGEIVRVVTIGDFSKELCGGTHVPSGARIGNVAIVSEESIGANTRRIEALCGAEAYRHTSRERLVAGHAARLLDARTDEVVDRIQSLMSRLRNAEKQLEQVREARISRQADELATSVERHDGTALVVRAVEVPGMDELRQLTTEIRGQLGERAVVVTGLATDEGKAQMVAALTDDLVGAGLEAAAILRPAAEVVGGGAGGSGGLAQAGGRHGDRLGEALAAAERAAGEALEGV